MQELISYADEGQQSTQADNLQQFVEKKKPEQKKPQTYKEIIDAILEDNDFLNILKDSLPKSIKLIDFVRNCKYYLLANTRFLTQTKNAIKLEILKAAKDGLMLDGKESMLDLHTSHGVSKIQYRALSWGMVKIIKKHTNIVDLRAVMIYSNDLFEYEEGDYPRIFHEILDLSSRGDITGCYAIAKDKDGQIYRLVLSRQDLDKRKASAKTTNIWTAWYDEMCQKTVLAKLFHTSIKYLVHEGANVLESETEESNEQQLDNATKLEPQGEENGN